MKPILIITGLVALYVLLEKRQAIASVSSPVSVPGGEGSSGGYSIPQLESAVVSSGNISVKPPSQVNVSQVTGSLIGSGAGVAASGAAIGSGLSAGTLTPITAVPLVGAIVAGSILIGTTLFKVLNHPLGTCGPDSKSMAEFLNCWNHPIPKNQMPFYSNKFIGARGWANFADCEGYDAGSNGKDWLAKNSQKSGCKPFPAGSGNCDTQRWIQTSGKSGCVAAPAGAILSLPDGTFLDAAGRNLGSVRPRS